MQRRDTISSDAEPAGDIDGDAIDIEPVLEVLRNRVGVDFRQYKRATLYRRIARRIGLHRLGSFASYVTKLKTDPREAEALYQDILIHVTSFFRNPEAYEALKAQIYPALTANRQRTSPVRIWTVGCSSGEEAYSLAMALTEHLEDADLPLALEIIGTDVNASSIERARRGVYANSAVEHISETRKARFFELGDGGYRIAQGLRDMCVFTRHNVLTDAPLSGFDLVSCRNMLIYLGAELQQKVIYILHGGLRPNGFLWLGNAESIGTHQGLFEVESACSKIYRKSLAKLGREPCTVRDVLQSGIEERDPLNEVLRVAHAEMQAANAELQIIIDEMEVSKRLIRSSEDAIEVINNELAARDAKL